MSDIPRIRHNIIANFAGKSWINILGLLIVPFYIKYLGVNHMDSLEYLCPCDL